MGFSWAKDGVLWTSKVRLSRGLEGLGENRDLMVAADA